MLNLLFRGGVIIFLPLAFGIFLDFGSAFLQNREYEFSLTTPLIILICSLLFLCFLIIKKHFRKRDEAGAIILQTLTGGTGKPNEEAGRPDGTLVADKDGAHPSHQDPRARRPYGHQPDVANSDGAPWLPIRELP